MERNGISKIGWNSCIKYCVGETKQKSFPSSDFTNQARTTFKKTIMLRQDSKTQPFAQKCERAISL